MPEIGKAWVTINARLAPLRKALNRAFSFTIRQVRRMSLIASGAFAAVAIASLKWASDLEEAVDKFKVALGDLAGPALAWVDQYSQALGYGKRQMIDFISAFQLMFQGLKIGGQEALAMSTNLTKLAFGFASLNNLDIDEAFIKLQAGLAGEIEPLRRFGVNLSVASMELFAVEKGIHKAWKEMTEAEKVTIRYNFIMEKLNVAMHNELTTASSLANRWKQFKGIMEQTGAAIGSVFVEEVADGLGKLSAMLLRFRPQIVQWFEDMKQKVIEWWTAIGGIPGIVATMKQAWAEFKVWYDANMKPIVEGLIDLAKMTAKLAPLYKTEVEQDARTLRQGSRVGGALTFLGKKSVPYAVYLAYQSLSTLGRTVETRALGAE